MEDNTVTLSLWTGLMSSQTVVISCAIPNAPFLSQHEKQTNITCVFTTSDLKNDDEFPVPRMSKPSIFTVRYISGLIQSSRGASC